MQIEVEYIISVNISNDFDIDISQHEFVRRIDLLGLLTNNELFAKV